MLPELFSECPLCGLSDVSHKWHVQFRDRDFDYVICKSCGMIYISPLPSLGEVLIAYHEESPEYNYQKDYFSFLERIEERDGPPTQMVRLIERYSPRCSPENIFALDVGAGTGSLLRCMRNMFDWQVEGIEPAPYSGRAAKKYNLNMHNVSIEEFETGRHYDVITMMSVIEHTPEPIKMLRKVRSLSKKDGLLVLETPNADSLSAMLRQSHWGPLLPPAHMLMFTPKTMSQLLTNTGFMPVKFLFPGSYPLISNFLNEWLRNTQMHWGISLPKMDSMLIFARPI